MSQRGPNLFSSDLGESIRKEFRLLYAYGYNVEDITNIFKKYYGNAFILKEDWNLFWLVMARIQIDLGVLQEEVKEEALKVIDSGEDIKQWEEYVEIEKYKINYAELSNNLILEMFNEQQLNDTFDPIEESVKKFKNIADQAKELTLNKNVPDFVREYYDKDSYSKIDIFGNDGKKYLKIRKEIINSLLDDINNFKPFKKRVSKPYHFSPGWKVGDVIAFKINKEFDNHSEIKDDYYGYYLLFNVTGINKKPLSKIIPNLVYEEDIFIAQYDFIAKELPLPEDLKHFDYITRKQNRTIYSGNELKPIKSDKGAINYYWLSFYNSIKKFKKIEFKKIASIDNYSDNVIHDNSVMLHVWDLLFIDELQNTFFKNVFNEVTDN